VSDLAVLVVLVVFFVLAAGYVGLCDRVTRPEQEQRR
jgi:hypothetical protein